MKELRIETDIEATPEQVWEVLATFGRYRKWNPYLVRVDSVATVGRSIRLRIDIPDGGIKTVTGVLTAFDPPHILAWKWRSGPPGFLSCDHSFVLESLDAGRVRVIDQTLFKGALASVYLRMLAPKYQRGMELMGEALKAQVATRAESEESAQA